jgi:preprotein translocase subunit SecE
VEEVLSALQHSHDAQGNEVVMATEVAQREGPGGLGKVVSFYHEVVAEMRKVTWPDRPQLKDTTIKIIIFVLFLGAVIGTVDMLLNLILVRGLPSLFAGR